MTDFTVLNKARQSGAATSQYASALLEDLRDSQREVLFVLAKHGPMIDEDLVNACYHDGVTQARSGIRTRRSELEDKGRVQATGEEGETRAGNPAIMWEAVISSDKVHEVIEG